MASRGREGLGRGGHGPGLGHHVQRLAADLGHPAVAGGDKAQLHQGGGLAGLIADLAGQRQRLLAHLAVPGRMRATVLAAAQQDLHPRRSIQLGRHQLQGPLQIGRTVTAELMAEAGPPKQQQRYPDRLRRRVQFLDPGAGESQATAGVPGVEGGLDRLLQHPGVIGADPGGRVRHLVPQLQHPGQHGQPLGVRHRLGLLGRGLPGADQRPGHVVGRVPVVGHLDVRSVRRHQVTVGLDGLREPRVQPAVLTRQQVVVHRLADQRVPEHVVVGLGDQDVRGHGGAQHPDQLVRLQAAHRGQQGVPDPAAARAGDPQHLLGLLGQAAHTDEHQVPQRVGQLAGLGVLAGQQGLQEQRVALGPPVQPVGPGRVGYPAGDPGGQLAGFAPGQPGQVDSLDPVDPVQLGDERPQRVGPVQLVGPVGDDDQHAVQRPLVADQERQQGPAGRVGPVRVLDGQHDRGGLGQPLQQHQHLLEQPGPGLARVDGGQRLAELGQQPGQLADGPARQQPGQPVGAELPHQVAEHGGERRERQPVGAELQAAAGQHPRPRGLLGRGELAEQPGLTHPGLAADEHAGGCAVAHRGQGRPQRGQLVRAAHQRGADRRRAHAFQDATRPRTFPKG